MASRASIEMDFRQAIAQANKVDELADRLSQVSNNQLGSTLQGLSSGWKGENAIAYLNKGAKLQNKINASSSELHNIASGIRRAAKRIYDADMENMEIAKARNY